MPVMNKKNIKEMIVLIAIMSLSFVMAMKSRFNYFTDGAKLPNDGNVFKCIGWLMGKGYVPYRDIFDHKGPALYFIEYISNFISTIRGIWVFECAAIFITLFCGYLICRRFNSRLMSIIVLLLSFARYSVCGYGNCIEEFSMPVYMYSILLFLDFYSSPNKYIISGNSKRLFCWAFVKIVLFGVGTSLIFWSKCNLIIPVFIFCVGIIVYCIREKQSGSLIIFILAFLLGFLIITLPCLLYIYKNGAWSDFIYDYFIFNKMYSTNTRRVNLYSRVNSITTFTVNIGCITAFAVMGFCIKKRTKRFLFDVSYLIFMVLVVFFTTMSAQTYSKMEIPIIVTFVYPYSQLFLYIDDKRNSNARYAILLYLFASFMVPLWSDMIKNTALDISDHIHGTQYVWKEDELIKYIRDNTEITDKMIVIGADCQIYMYANREPASRYIYLPDITVDSTLVDGLFRDLESNPPKVVVVASENRTLVKKVDEFVKKHGYKDEYDQKGKWEYPVYIK